MTAPGFLYQCDVVRVAPLSGRDNTTARPTFGEPTVVAAGVECAAGEFMAERHEYGLQGKEAIFRAMAVHVRHGIDVLQGDQLTLHGSPWDGTYRVFDVRKLAIHQRILAEAVSGA